MNSKLSGEALLLLQNQLEGELLWDTSTLLQYATDASAYREVPCAVALPRSNRDIIALVGFAREYGIPLIPRAAGTSLAGQVVGRGIVVDISRYWGSIIELNVYERWVRVQPGVILDELNAYIKPHGLFFGPETSTSNRCMMGGMVGNNSCGAHSILYGSTRDHTISVKMVLDDGAEYEFGPLSQSEYYAKLQIGGREGDLYRRMHEVLAAPGNREEIEAQYPEPSIRRRNTGYALDLLYHNQVFASSNQAFNLCSLIAGSEGTLGIITEVKLNLVELPPREKALVCVHLARREQAFEANLIALRFKPGAVELMDHQILECTKGNIEQQRNRWFVHGDPGAILIVEFARSTRDEIVDLSQKLESELREAGYGYHFPVVWGDRINSVWALRKAGLGLLSNIEGDASPVSLVEDTAVAVERLPNYMKEFGEIMEGYGLSCVYHAHIGSGELHLRPVLNLKDPKDVELFRIIAFDVARLVKKYRGSLSGEHGDGRLRGELIPIMLGEKVYQLLREVKSIWDPSNIFNPNKIVDTPPNNTSFRFTPAHKPRNVPTMFRFDREGGILRAAEKCNGSADCRKTQSAGGTMCPSYMATRSEANSTRARANILREFLTRSDRGNPFNHREIYNILDLCLSCKGCKHECPSSVDMAKLKAEFLHQWYKSNGVPIRTRAIANITRLYKLGSIAPGFTNLLLSNRLLSDMVFRPMGFDPRRTLPKLSPVTLRGWSRKREATANPKGRVFLLADEFTNYNDTHIGVKAIELLERLGYEVIFTPIRESGRTYISKGLLRTARKLASRNIRIIRGVVNSSMPLVGIEPSAILSFRDEYPDLVETGLRDDTLQISKNCLLLEEFIMREVSAGRIDSSNFDEHTRVVKLHGHCQMKAITSTAPTRAMLALPKGHQVSEIPSGCCGMAGSFGYEREHYDLSMAIGELILFPGVRNSSSEEIIAAPGTSCRQHIKDGTGRKAVHPVEIMWEALRRG